MCKLNMDINFLLNKELAQLAACNVLACISLNISVKLNLLNILILLQHKTAKVKVSILISFIEYSCLLKCLMAIKS